MNMFKLAINNEKHNTIAAIDLGSNSFHLKVAEIQGGRFVVVDRLRETVQLAAGLDKKNYLSAEKIDQAVKCLAQFGQRIKNLSPNNIRAVGTNTLRHAKNINDFIVPAEEALGCPIEIISGREEARLIYCGVSHNLPPDGKKRLIIDIGGGSTEVILGKGSSALNMESINVGCVTLTKKHDLDQKFSTKKLNQAYLNSQLEFSPIAEETKSWAWKEAIGTSGTIRAIYKVLNILGKAEGETISYKELLYLSKLLGKIKSLSELGPTELNEKRASIFPAGVMLLLAIFESLNIKKMRIEENALREGLLYDLIGRLQHQDIRSETIKQTAEKYQANLTHASYVANTASGILDSVAPTWKLGDEQNSNCLEWACQLHEIGLSISHSQYHKHGAYIIENADLMGFSRLEQKFIATLVRFHRRRLNLKYINELSGKRKQALLYLAIILRISVMLHRSRHYQNLPALETEAGENDLKINFPKNWIEEHPLTLADLEREQEHLGEIGFNFTFC